MKPLTIVIQIDQVEDTKGSNRYDTAKDISKKVQQLIENNLPLVVVDQEIHRDALYGHIIHTS